MWFRKYLYKSDEGFSTIEVIVSMVVLSIIIVTAFVALSSLSFFSTWDKQTLQSSTLASTKMAQASSLLESIPSTFSGVLMSGVEELDGVNYSFTVTTEPSTLSSKVLLVKVSLSWDFQKPRTYEITSYKVVRGN